MAHNSSINPDVDGCFEVTLASRLGTSKHLQTQQAISQYRWGSYRLSPTERLELATALYWEFCGRLCRVRHDEQSLQILQEKYNQIRDFVAPIYRLPPEILAEIFSIDLEGRQSPIRLMLVCQHWCTVVDSLASMWESLKLGTWTSPARVERSLKRAWWLNVVIHTEEGIEKGQGGDEAYIALALAAGSAYRWKRLTIESLPHDARLEEVAHPVPSFASLSPIKELNYLKTTSQAESSPLLAQLLENIGSAAVGNLSTMETTSLYTIQQLLQPAYTQSFHFLTTLHMAIRNLGDEVDLLPHLLRLEVLHITNVSLPSYADHLNLPLTSSLRQLCLNAVSVQWMGGRIFPKLQSCAITSPPHYPPLLSDVDCPICTDLEFRNWNVRVAGQFRTPMIHSLAIKSNEWTPVRGSKQVILLCSVGLGFQLQPRVLHLATLCKEYVLLSILELLPALEELWLDIERPCALGRRFFTSLLAKPANDLRSDILREWEALPMSMETRKSAICPFLKRLELKYERWLRQTEPLDILSPLMALSWSREGTTTPLECFRLCFKDSNAQWNVLEPKGFDLSNGILDIPQLQPYLGSQFLGDYPFFKSCVMATATSVIYHDSSVGPMGEFQRLLPLFRFYFRHLCILRVCFSYDQFPKFEILPNFFRLEELDLSSVDIPSYSIQIDLPFVRTLRRLSLRSTTLTWMDGRVFPRLKRFYLCNDRPVSFPKTASLPVCTHINYLGEDYHRLRSAFLVPALFIVQRCRVKNQQEFSLRDPSTPPPSLTYSPIQPPRFATRRSTHIRITRPATAIASCTLPVVPIALPRPMVATPLDAKTPSSYSHLHPFTLQSPPTSLREQEGPLPIFQRTLHPYNTRSRTHGV